MKYRWLIALLVLLAVAAIAAAAYRYRLHAKHETVVPVLSLAQQQQRDVTIARRYWGGTKCDAPAPIQYKRLRYSVLAYSDFYINQPGDYYTNCRVVLNSVRIPTESAAKLCAVLVHEYGHLAGRHHVSDPYSIMYPMITNKNIPGACR